MSAGPPSFSARPSKRRGMLGAPGAAGQEAEGIGELAVHEHFVVEVGACRAASRADVADDLTAANWLTRGDNQA